MAEKTQPAPGRRQVLQVLAGSVGAGLAGPALAPAGTHAHAAAPPTAGQASAALPGFLDAGQLETLASMAEAIIPGSTEAGVAPFVDRLLAVDPPEKQRELLSAMGALEAESLTRFGKTWRSLDAAQRTTLLAGVSTAPSSKTPRYWKPGEPVLVADPPKRPPTVRDRFEALKGRIAAAYYSSEKGMKELGWTGNLVHGGYPGCTHEGGHRSS